MSVGMRGFLHVIKVGRFNKIDKLAITDLIQARIFQNNHITTISHKPDQYIRFTINTILLALCHSDMFEPSKGHLRGVVVLVFSPR